MLGHAPASLRVLADQAHALLHQGHPFVEDLDLALQDPLPDAVGQPVALAAGSWNPFPDQEAQAAEVAHRAGDCCRADLQGLGQLR